MNPLIMSSLIGAGASALSQGAGAFIGNAQMRQEMNYAKSMAEWNNILARQNYDYQYHKESPTAMYNLYRGFLSPTAAAQAASGVTPSASLSFSPASPPSGIAGNLAQMVGGSFNNIASALSSYLPNIEGTPQNINAGLTNKHLHKQIIKIGYDNDLTAEQVKQAQYLSGKLWVTYEEDIKQSRLMTQRLHQDIQKASYEINKIRAEASQAEASAEIEQWKKDTLKQFGFLPDMDAKSMIINMILQGKGKAAIDTISATFKEFLQFGKKKFREWW